MMPIERMRPEDFDAVFRLLARSFPAGERRDKAGQRALLADSAYQIDILRAPSGGVQALMASWDFGGFVFFEHFAVDPACRNGGIGGQMLDALLARFDKPACLEAELPETELAARRIGFYERHGFTVNADYPYFQPTLTPGGSQILLKLAAACLRRQQRLQIGYPFLLGGGEPVVGLLRPLHLLHIQHSLLQRQQFR